MIIKSLAVLAGACATGKGTRLSQLIKYLIDSNYSYEIITMRERSNKVRTSGQFVTYPIGIYFKDFNLFILGKWVKSNKSGLLSWNSADYVNTSWGFDNTVKIAKMLCDHNFVCEGYVSMTSSMLQPDSMIEYSHFFSQVYWYETNNKQDMMNRIIGRSKLECRGDAAFASNITYPDFYKSFKSLKRVSSGEVNLYSKLFNYDAPITQFGHDYMEFLGVDKSIIIEFELYSTHCRTLRHYSDMQSNEILFGDLFKEQLQYCSDNDIPSNLLNTWYNGTYISRGKEKEGIINDINYVNRIDMVKRS